MIFPSRLQCVAVVTTTNPVTHTLVVAVNNASINGVICPSAAENGIVSNTAPTKMAAAKLNTTSCVVVKRFLFLSISLYPLLKNTKLPKV